MRGRSHTPSILSVCGAFLAAAALSFAFTPPQTEEGENGWETYVDAPTLDKPAARDLKPGQDSPEAAVVHFYASLLRGDREYLQVLPPEGERTTQCQYALEKIQTWNFNKFRLVARKKTDDDTYWIRVFFEVVIDEEDVESGEDEATVKKVEGKWFVVSPPA